MFRDESAQEGATLSNRTGLSASDSIGCTTFGYAYRGSLAIGRCNCYGADPVGRTTDHSRASHGIGAGIAANCGTGAGQTAGHISLGSASAGDPRLLPCRQSRNNILAQLKLSFEIQSFLFHRCLFDDGKIKCNCISGYDRKRRKEFNGKVKRYNIQSCRFLS